MTENYVYVLDKDGKPLMPTKRFRKVRLWLKAKKAKVVSHEPFTIKLLFDTGNRTQKIKLGMDPGYANVGLSATSDKREYFRAEVELRTNISELMKERLMYRKARRARKTRYRKPRFLNRRKLGGSRKVLPPSLEQKINSHLKLVSTVQKILPITEVIWEYNNFDILKMKNPTIHGVCYQKGEQFGYENTKAYVRARDRHKCYFNNNICVVTLHVHHIVFRRNGGSDAPSNLLTLCDKHHELLHKGKVSLGKNFTHKSYKEATAMNIIRSQLQKKLPTASITYGYITKETRILFKIPKTHSNDAFVISGGSTQDRCPTLKFAFKRKNNRGIQMNKKGYKPAIRRRRYSIQPKDIVKWNGRICRSRGSQNLGKYILLDVDKKPKPIRDVTVIFHEKTLYVIR